MSRLRSSLHRKAVLVLTLLVLCGGLLAYAAPDTPQKSALVATSTDFGTPAQQEAVRTDREASMLPPRTTCSVVSSKELFITHVSVVDDCWRTAWSGTCPTPTVTPARRGAWTMGRLLPGIFGTNDPAALSDLTLRWLQEWETMQTVVGDEIPARPAIRDVLTDPWLAASGGIQLDMKKAPFRLLAIVSRLDLRQNSGYSEGPSAGEARFIFNVLDENGSTTPFTVIVEYGLDAAGCADVLDWADAWHSLGAHPFGDDYNAALQTVTDLFTTIGSSPDKLNRSAINQVRTNEIELASPWELREFRLKEVDTGIAPLVQRPVAQTPRRDRHQTTHLANFININEAAILKNQHTVPVNFQQQPFLGGASPNSLNLGWDGPGAPCSSINNDEARHVFSLNTCSGCHGHETGVEFLQVEPRQPGSASVLSKFLTGGSKTDRCGLAHNFNDINRRRVDLCQLLEKSCTQLESEPAVTFVH